VSMTLAHGIAAVSFAGLVVFTLFDVGKFS
jgi:hypothetical protein